MTHELSDDLFEKFSHLLSQYSGIHIRSVKKLLVINRLRKRLKILELNDYMEYYRYLKQNDEEIEQFVNALSTNESFFFRNNKQISLYQSKIVSEIIKAKGFARIWSAGCATGEEPYSLLIASNEGGFLANVEIIASDINTEVLEEAKRAIYNERKVKYVPDEFFDRYFIKINDDKYAFNATYKRYINFFQHNLINDKYPESIDIIFCRNVLIYFNEKIQKEIVHKFYSCLNNQGFLFVGHAEAISQLDTEFHFNKINETTVYTKNPYLGK